MNKIHRLIWSAVRNAWIVAPENANSRGKPASRPARLAALGLSLIAQTAYAQAPAPNTLPTGGQVVAGQAAISQAGSAMTIQQGSNQAILNWNSFNIGSQASVNFQQPNVSAVALNRVVGSDPSSIYGSLTANGQVFLVNPNGVLFGQGARVDVGGLVASTLNIRNEDFLNGNYRFTRDGATAGVTNQGELLGKYVALLAPEVRNEGVIAASMGTAALAAGEAVTLGLTGNNLIDVQVDQASINTLVENKHLVKADGGMVVLSAQSAHTLLGQVVNSGAIEAQGLVNDGGTVRLLASSSIDHSGSIAADAGTNGNGGSVILMGDLANPNSHTQVSGSISAKGGTTSGNGGFIETSGSHLNIADTVKIDTSAANGKGGTWLLDPVDITVANSGGTVSVSTLQTALASGNVILDTSNATSCVGVDCSSAPATGDSITIADNITWSSANFLQLWSEGTINVNAVVHNTNTAGGGIQFNTFMGTVAFGANGLVKISNAEQLQLINTATDQSTSKLVGNYELANNIDASLGVMSTNIVWTPIGVTGFEFAGTLDGKGYTVSGIRMDASQTNEAGLFGVIDTTGVVRNVGVVDPVEPFDTATHRIGALAGINKGRIENSYVRSTTTTLTGNGNVVSAGGLVGENSGTIRNSYTNIAVDATGATAQGGLVGNNSGTIEFSYSIGAVSANAASNGGLVGSNTGTITSSFYNSDTSIGASGYNALGTAKTTAELKTPATFTGWETASIWNLVSNSYPVFQYDAAGNLVTVYVRLIGGSSTYGEVVNLSYGLFNAAAGGTSISDATPIVTTLAWTGTVPTSTSNVGGYSLTYSGGITLGNTAYSLAAGDATTWTINPRPVTITPNSGQSKVYGEADPTYTYAVQSGTQGTGAGLLSGNNLSLSGALGRAAGENVANGPYAYTLNNLAAANSNYSIALSGSAPTFAITPRTVTLNASKTYDGTTALSGTQVAIGNTVGTQTLTYTGATASDAHVATANKYISAIALADGLNGGLASNYQPPSLASASPGVNTVTISAKTLTPTLSNTGVTKEYDGATGAPTDFNPSYSFNGLVSGDTAATLTPTAMAYNSKDVATANKITVSGLTISGITGSNGSVITDYVLDATSKELLGATITKKAIAVSFTPTTLSKVYDGNTSATVNTGDLPGFNFNGFAGNEYLIPGSLDTTTGTIPGTYSGKDAAAGLTVTVPMSGWGLPSALAGGFITVADPANYNLPASFTVAGEITKRPITGQLVGTISKTYDGTANATIALSNVQYDTTGYVAGELAYINGTSWQSGTFVNASDQADAHAGQNKKIIVNITPAEYAPWPGSTTNINNYSFPATLIGNVGTITPATLTATLTNTNVTKVYDGNTNAPNAFTPSYSITGLVTNDTAATLTNTAVAYNSKDVATANKITISGLAINGITGSNGSAITDYVLDAVSKDIAATISKKDIAVSLSAPVSKVYDGTTTAAVNANHLQINGFVSGEYQYPLGSLNLTDNTMPGTFSDKNVPLAGAPGLTVTVPLSGWQNTPLGSADPANYNLPASFTATGEITKRPITVDWVLGTNKVSKVYDGNDQVSLFDIANSKVYVVPSGFAGSEALFPLNASNQPSLWGTYDLTDAGTTRTVTLNLTGANWQGVNLDMNVGGFVLDAANGNPNNYSFPSVTLTTTQAEITPRPLTLAASKVYDGSTNLTAAQITLGNLVPNQTLTLGGTATASDAHVATANKYVSDTTGLTLGSGSGLVSNYQFPAILDSTNAPVTIDKADLALSGTRHYDGTTTINTSAATTTTLTATGVNNESFAVTGTSSISAKDASTTPYALIDATGLNVGASKGANPGMASDYNALSVNGSSFTVTRRPITAELVSTFVPISKVYDGTTTASVSAWNFNYDVANYVTGEGAYLAGTNSWQSGSYDTKNVGTGKRVTVNVAPADYVATGTTNLNNYIFVDKATGVENQVTGDIGAISKKPLTASTLMAAQDKVYDGLQTATITLADQNSLLGLESIDFNKVAATASGLFDSAAAGLRTATASFVLSGTEAGNYSIADVGNLTATISPRPVTATAKNVFKLPNTDDPALAFTVEPQGTDRGLVTGETLSGNLTRDIGESIGTYAITQGGVTNANNPNYEIAFTPATFSIRQVLQPGTQFAGMGTVESLNGLVDYAVSGKTTTLKPTDTNILINWYSLSLPTDQTLVFDQPSASSVAVNRVTGATPSNLFGSLKSNGIVFLINPNGILFGPGASVDVGGLVASAMNVKGLPLTTSPTFATDMTSLLSQPSLQFEGAAGDVNLQSNLTFKADSFAGFYGNTVNLDGTLTLNGGATAAAKNANWNNLNSLMLSAQDNINLNSPMEVKGTGRLVLETGQASASGGASDYSVFAAPTLAKTSSFATRQGNTGTLQEYTVVSDFSGLSSLSGNAGNVAIGANFSVSSLGNYKGFDTSLFAGLGHEISGWTGSLYINYQYDYFNGMVNGNDNGNGMVNTLSGTMRDIGISINGTYNAKGGLAAVATDGPGY
jgi:filamentous hemagglutinin family protein